MATPRVQDYAKLIELPVQRKLLSQLQGRHGGTGAGSSHEFLDMAEYKVGDDISDIDWKSTARMRQPIVKRFEQTAVLNVVLGVDTGANMGALAPGTGKPGTLLESKEDVAAELVGALAWLTAYRGDHLGLVAGNADGLTTLPARSGAIHAQTLASIATSAEPTGAPSNFSAVMRRIDATRRGKALVIGITDTAGLDATSDVYLKRVAARHKLLMVLVQDADPTQIQGSEAMRDVAAGPVPDFVRRDKTIESQWQTARQVKQYRAVEKLKRYGIDWVAISSKEEVPTALLSLIGGGKHGS